jgi:hypothetical protein
MDYFVRNHMSPAVGAHTHTDLQHARHAFGPLAYIYELIFSVSLVFRTLRLIRIIVLQ